MNRVLIIDALNMYFRAYIVDPSRSTAGGQPIGGVKGFLKILQKLMRETKPNQVVICWDGPGGSQKRKSIVKEYKEGRKPIRLNRDIRNLSEEEEIENKIWQQTRLFEYLNTVPIIQLMLDGVEADDIISHVAQHQEYKGWEKVIVSSDKDFYQLCDNETVVFRPIQKEVKNKPSIIKEFGIHPVNFALARAIAGDKSDNLPGVEGVGLPTVAKRLPFLANDKSYTLNDIYDHCSNTDSGIKAYENITKQFDKVKLNYKMMQLYSPIISAQGVSKLNHSLSKFDWHFNKTEFRKMMIEDGFGPKWGPNEMFQQLNKIAITKGQ